MPRFIPRTKFNGEIKPYLVQVAEVFPISELQIYWDEINFGRNQGGVMPKLN